MNPEQAEQLRDRCLTNTRPTYLQDRDEAILALACDAGLCAGKLACLDVEHVDFDAGSVFISSGRSDWSQARYRTALLLRHRGA